MKTERPTIIPNVDVEKSYHVLTNNDLLETDDLYEWLPNLFRKIETKGRMVKDIRLCNADLKDEYPPRIIRKKIMYPVCP